MSARRHTWPAAVLIGTAALACFLLAALCYPGGGYNPFTQMLSVLGRTVVREVRNPVCHYLFAAGMFGAAAGVACVLVGFALWAKSGWRRIALISGAALNAAGLCAIALSPENLNALAHNAGCWTAAIGGALAAFACDGRGRDRAWTLALGGVSAAFGAAAILHATGLASFSPWMPTAQKALIATFAAWIGALARRGGAERLRTWHKAVAGTMLAACGIFALATAPVPPPKPLPAADAPADDAARPPMTDDERAALRWLDHVTGDLPDAEEKDWWNFGGDQYGIFAKRYSLAFCGYAAAALGMRGGEAERKAVGRILGNCVRRYLDRGSWAYAARATLWGREPWAPDPCFRENVMYTGHLLQLLALYETFTGDARYWKEGFDFVWSRDVRIHYTVQKLVDVTVHQMRHGPNGGVCCEPGLMFFPCNNHPHVALALFAKLGHGDWTADARRWEKWALARYRRPLFGGGALNIVYHVKSGMMYQRALGGLDGWSLLWYEPWAADRGVALALWREAAERIDWAALESAPPGRQGSVSCCTPVDVPVEATTTFLAAAARACDDEPVATRLERLADRHLVRRNGMLYLDVGRDWRVGVTANRIISLAEANGFRFRDLLRRQDAGATARSERVRTAD